MLALGLWFWCLRMLSPDVQVIPTFPYPRHPPRASLLVSMATLTTFPACFSNLTHNPNFCYVLDHRHWYRPEPTDKQVEVTLDERG